MHRQARLDAPGVLQHIIIRGIERQKISKYAFLITVSYSSWQLRFWNNQHDYSGNNNRR